LDFGSEAFSLQNLKSEIQNSKRREGDFFMAEIQIKENETLDDAMKRFKKKVQDAGILQEMKKREYYEPPSVRRKQKMWAASKKRKKNKRRI